MTERLCVSGLLALLMLCGAEALAGEFSGLAHVNDDATLSIRHRRVALWGIVIPQTPDDCERFFRPVTCGQEAALALRFKAEGFVHCSEQERDEGLVRAVCRVNDSKFERGLDLGAWLIEQGLAMALPEAPIEYQVLERLARDSGRGLWGLRGTLRR